MLKTILLTKALVAAGDYAAEDVMSGSTTASDHQYWYFPKVVTKGEDFAYIVKAQAIWITTALTPKLTLYLFKEPPTMELRDNVANTSPGTNDLSSYQGRIDFPAMQDLGGMSTALATFTTDGNLPLLFQTAPGNTGLYGILVTRDAITGEAAGATMTLSLSIETN